VVDEKNVYLAAGVWPFMGVLVYAVDVESAGRCGLSDSMSFTWRRCPTAGPKLFGPDARKDTWPSRATHCRAWQPLQPGLVPIVRNGQFLGYAPGTGPYVAASSRGTGRRRDLRSEIARGLRPGVARPTEAVGRSSRWSIQR